MEKIAEKEEEVFNAMDFIAYLIKDDLPAVVVQDLPALIEHIPGFKDYLDFKAFVIIEFWTKANADTAKKEGFKYQHNGQECTNVYASSMRTVLYVQDKFIGNIGSGY